MDRGERKCVKYFLTMLAKLLKIQFKCQNMVTIQSFEEEKFIQKL